MQRQVGAPSNVKRCWLRISVMVVSKWVPLLGLFGPRDVSTLSLFGPRDVSTLSFFGPWNGSMLSLFGPWNVSSAANAEMEWTDYCA